jgi:hypothetical protein
MFTSLNQVTVFGTGCTQIHIRYRLYANTYSVPAVRKYIFGTGCTQIHIRDRLYANTYSGPAVRKYIFGTGCTQIHIRYRLYANTYSVPAVRKYIFGTGCTQILQFFHYTAQSVSTECSVLHDSLLEMTPLNLALGWLLTFPHNVSMFCRPLNTEAPRSSDT